MRSARKLRRIYVFTILIWCLGLFVFWVIRGLHTLSGDPLDVSYYDSNSNITQLIYFSLLVVALIVVLLLETVIFSIVTRKSSSSKSVPNQPEVREPRLDSKPSHLDP